MKAASINWDVVWVVVVFTAGVLVGGEAALLPMACGIFVGYKLYEEAHKP